MAVITASNLNAVIDHCVRCVLRALGTQASGLGLGTPGGAWGANGAIADLKTDALAFGDLDPVAAVAQPLDMLSFDANAVAGAVLGQFLRPLSHHCASFGIASVSSLDSYLTYLNTVQVTKWQALQHPSWRDLFVACGLQQPVPSVCNLYFEVVQGATYAQALGGLVVGTGFTPGQVIDQTKYAGGFPQIHVTAITGSGLVTVTGTAFDPVTKKTTAGVTWTATASGTGVVVLTPGTAPANSLIGAVSAISVAAGISAGTIYAEAVRPTGRPTLP